MESALDIISIEERNDYKDSKPKNLIQFRYLLFYLFIHFLIYTYINIEHHPKTRPAALPPHLLLPFLLHHLLY